MPNSPEVDAFNAKWGLAAAPEGGPAAPEQAQAAAAVQPAATAPAEDPDVAAFNAKWGLGGQQVAQRQPQVNAPPGSVTATPSMGMQQLYGRSDEQGQPVQLDQNSGLTLRKYWSISQQSDPEAKADYLQKLYPKRKVRILDTGDVTLEVPDSTTGKMKDVVINPTGIDAHDLLDLAASAPELAAGIAAAVATRGRGALKTAAQLISSAFASGFTGKVRDVATRELTGIPVRPEDISSERNTQTALDMFGQVALGAGGKAMRALSPFAREAPPGSLTFNLNEGRAFLKNNYDLDFQTTPGTRTGNASLLAIEAAESPMPGSRSVMGKIQSANNATIQEAQRLATGNVTPEEQIGMNAIRQLEQNVVKPIEDAFDAARTIALQKGDKRIEALLNDAVEGTPTRAVPGRVTPSEAGEVTSKEFEQRMGQAKIAVDAAYAKVNALPGGTGDVLDGTPAADAARTIRAGLTKMTTATGTELLPSGIPGGLIDALKDLERLRGNKVSLQTLTNLKKAAYDAIAAFKTAHGDVKDRWFNQIADAYEQGIDQGISNTGNPALKQALTDARDTYKREMVPLERVGVKELAKDEFDPGHLSPQQVMERVFEGPKALQNYNMLKETLGAGNVAFKALKRAWVDLKVAQATDKATGALRPDELYQVFSDLDTHQPEMAREILGKNYKALMQSLRVRGAAEAIGVKSIDEAELRTLLNLSDPSVSDLKLLARAAKTRDTAYVNGVYKDIRDGMPLRDFQPATFVDKLRNADMPTEQVKDVLSKLDPSTRDAVATAEFYRLLQAASVREGETAAKAMAGQPTNLSPTRLVEAMGTGRDLARTKLLLAEDLPAPGAQPPPIATGGAPQATGANRMEVLDALVRVLAPKEAAKTAFATLGSIGSGMAIRKITTGPLQYAGDWAKNMVLATAYVKGLGHVLTNRVFDDETTAVLANTLIASEPFIRASTETFGDAATKSMIAEVKSSIDQYVRKLHDSPEGRKREAAKQFMQGGNVPMQMGTGAGQ